MGVAVVHGVGPDSGDYVQDGTRKLADKNPFDEFEVAADSRGHV